MMVRNTEPPFCTSLAQPSPLLQHRTPHQASTSLSSALTPTAQSDHEVKGLYEPGALDSLLLFNLSTHGMQKEKFSSW